MITHLAKETGQQKGQCGWGLQVTGKSGGGEIGQNLKKGRAIGNICIAPLCQLCKEALKISHPPITVIFEKFHPPLSLRHSNTGLVSSGASLTSWGEGVSLALVGCPSSDGVTIQMPYGVDILHRPASHPIFSYWVG